jgi:ribonuclease HI
MADTVITIYTDGACEPNPGTGGWASIIVNGETEETLVGSATQTTNNRMEILAALSALEVIRPSFSDRVVVVTDSKYLANGASSWLAGWKQRGWRTKQKAEVLNRDLWERLDAVLQRHAKQSVKVEWQWQRGHVGHLYNERCDALATAAARGK